MSTFYMSGVTLILDAMGVVFTAADDVAELLVPFIAEQGGLTDFQTINKLYTQASLGQLSAEQFWRAVRLSPNVENEYLARHRLNDGLLDFLQKLPRNITDVWCLSNDVHEWSLKLRQMFQLPELIAGFVISGEVGFRKPDPKIYEILLDRLRQPAHACAFVDDRPKNLQTAESLGFRTILFDPLRNSVGQHFASRDIATSFKHLAELLGN